MITKLENIKIGMCVGQDLFTESGQLITPNNTIVTPQIIERLKKFNISYVEMVDDTKEAIFDVKTTEGFKAFKDDCDLNKENLSSSFQEILKSGDEADSQIDVIKDLSSALYENNKSNLHLIDMIYNLQDFSDTVYIHSLNVGMIAGQLGRWLDFSEENVQLLTSCGLFHDIGKLLIPKEILEKPDKLTPEEFKIIQTHTTKGFEFLNKFDGIDERIKKVALFHHERCDGTGYPMHFSGVQLDDFTKIIAIADTYEAMTSERTYREPICPFTVVGILEKEGLRKFETKFVMKFLEKMVNSYLQNDVVLSNGKHGKIIMINRNTKSRPLIELEDGSFVDLAHNLDLQIVKVAK